MLQIELSEDSVRAFVKAFINNDENYAEYKNFVVELDWHGEYESNIGYQIFKKDAMEEPIISYGNRGTFICDHKALIDGGEIYSNGIYLPNANIDELDEEGISELVNDLMFMLLSSEE